MTLIPRKFKKKPVVVDAVKWDGSDGALGVVCKWQGDRKVTVDIESRAIVLESPGEEPTLTATLGDWVVYDSAGFLFVLPTENFLARYDPC